MKVICAGLPKTGTKSMCAALRMLGLQVYDFEEQAWYIGNKLKKALEVGCTVNEYREMFEGVDAVTDAPSCFLWKDLSEAFPEAKIIFWKRTTEEIWIKSLQALTKKINERRFLRFIRCTTYTGSWIHSYGNILTSLGLGQTGIRPWQPRRLNVNAALMRYREHNCYVLEAAPKERTLFFDIKDGWKPLCTFLEKPIPEGEFPFLNESSSVVNQVIQHAIIFNQIKKELFFNICLAFVVLAFLIRYLLF